MRKRVDERKINRINEGKKLTPESEKNPKKLVHKYGKVIQRRGEKKTGLYVNEKTSYIGKEK